MIGLLSDHFQNEGQNGYKIVCLLIILWLGWMVLFCIGALFYNLHKTNNKLSCLGFLVNNKNKVEIFSTSERNNVKISPGIIENLE